MIFRNWVLQNFPYLEDDFDALTDYELFSKICGYVIKYSKDNEEMKKKIAEFQHYFDNLDVQEEIDNKLDEMAASGELAEIINEEIFEGLNADIKYNKLNQLVDNVQFTMYSDLSSIFGVDLGWAVSACYLKEINNNVYGIICANDYTSNNPTYIERFNIRTFNFNDNTISDVTERYTEIPGHANGVAYIGNNKVLIVGTPYFYIYDLINNTYTSINNLLDSGWISMVTNDDLGNVYGCQDWNYDTSSVMNRFFNFTVDNEEDTISIASFREIPNLKEHLQKNEQGMVIYNGLLIFPSFSNNKLCIYNWDSLEYIKTQQIVAPYEVEFEDGFIYDDKLLMIDSYGRLFEPDIYGRNVIGGYSGNNIARSNTDICLLDEPVKLQSGEYVDLKFSKFLTFMNGNSDSDIGTFGSKLESITIYVTVRTYDTSNGTHNLAPIEIPLYKNIKYSTDTFNWLAYHWQTYYVGYADNVISRHTYFGTYSFRGSEIVPQLRFTFDEKYLEENFDTSDNTSSWDTTPVGYPATLYITKIIGHKKVGLKY